MYTTLLSLWCLASLGSVISESATDIDPVTPQHPKHAVIVDGATVSPSNHLAVVVPTHRGELPRAVSSLQRWPSSCSPVTKRSADLVLYYAEGDEDSAVVAEAVQAIAATAGLCFATTRVVYANVKEEEDVYPKGPSVQFYKMFLDEDVRPQLQTYDALAIIEWDVLVADDRSFEELYKAAFSGTGDFWVKGSNIGGTSFHPTSEVQEMWNILGHINGNAIYNNNDPAFVEYVEYTRARWQYDYSYDVALWLTISDFPYSWPLWQRYNSKFVTTNLISYVGAEHVDSSTVSDAVAGNTLFIHGSKIDEGNIASIKAASDQTNGGLPDAPASHPRLRASVVSEPFESVCSSACGNHDNPGLFPSTSTICDKSCTVGGRFGGFLCGAGDPEKFGNMCRLCFTDTSEARKVERELVGVDPVAADDTTTHVIMCDTMQPPQLEDCTDKCIKSKDAVCDSSCGTGLYGDYNCNWRNHGDKCRFCFDDQEAALMADEVAKRHGGRVIMCSTLEPPQAAGALPVTNSKMEPRKLQGGDDESCFDGCDYTNNAGERGRACDASCQTGIPFGTYGCSARNGKYGADCRVCYIDMDKAIKQMDKGNTVVMCDTLAPPNIYRRLRPVDEPESALSVARKLRVWRDSVNENDPDPDQEKAERKDARIPNQKTAKWRKTPEKRGITWPRNLTSDPDCLDDCVSKAKGGIKGLVCDVSCSTGEPYGTYGCSAKGGKFGTNCRTCYTDMDKAIAQMKKGNTVIMCSTLAPPEIYTSYETDNKQSVVDMTRRLREEREQVVHLKPDTNEISVAGRDSSYSAEDGKSAATIFEELAHRPFSGTLVRSNLCAFVAGRPGDLSQVEVTVSSVLQFIPGMRVAVAAMDDCLDAYESALGGYPGVSVTGTSNPYTASLFADSFCGDDTSIILYMESGSIVSRSFTLKDTHSPRGDLLVVYDGARPTHRDAKLARQTAFLLGFKAPSFTHGPDLFLPIGANADLRKALSSDVYLNADKDEAALDAIEALELTDFSAIPQFLAALQYSTNHEGTWFVNPQEWVTQHMFKSASIWEIPLVKPRFTCSLPPTVDPDSIDVADVLQRNLEFFSKGGTCDDGMITLGI